MKPEIDLHEAKEKKDGTILVSYTHYDEETNTTVTQQINKDTLIEFVEDERLNEFEHISQGFHGLDPNITVQDAETYLEENLIEVVKLYLITNLS